MTDCLQIISPAFTEGEEIPAKYSCKGENVSPPLSILNTPAGTESLALILHDPDAPIGDFLHWTLWNIPPGTTEIAEDSTPEGSREGKTGFGAAHYGGPCPPSGIHHYVFDLYALDTRLDLAVGTSRSELEEAMEGHILATAQLIGTFSAE